MRDLSSEDQIRWAAFEHVRHLQQLHAHLTAREIGSGFIYQGERIPLVNPRRGIFKPRQMQFLLSIKTVLPQTRGQCLV